MRYSAEEAAAIITQEPQDNLLDLSDESDKDFPVVSGSDIESEIEEVPNQTQLMKTNWSKTFLELVQYRYGE